MKLFVATGLAVASANDCGSCWEADSDGVCVPQSGKVTTTCGSNSIQVQIDPCLFEGTHNYADAFVGSNAGEVATACQLSEQDDGLLVMEHGVDECGTSMEYDSENDKIKFTNEMTIPSQLIDDTIFTSAPISWNFQCVYDTSIEISSDEISMDASSRTGDFSGVGQFDVAMSFFKSINFDEEIASPEHQVGQAINFGVTFNNAVPINGLQFAPTSCEVINVNNEAEVYDLWDSSDEMMCNGDHPVNFEVFETPADSAFYGFQYTGFAFTSVVDDVGPQRLKCHVEICHDDTENSPCSTGCFGEPTTTTTSTTTSTSTTTTIATTTTTSTTSAVVANPNTHRLCGKAWLDGWTSACSQPDECYSYVHSDDYWYNPDTYDYYYEDFSCEFTVAIQCDANFVDTWGDDCDWYAANVGDIAGCGEYSNEQMLKYGYLTDEGFKTGLQCPQCGCATGAGGAINMNDREGARSLIGGGDDKKTPKN